MGKKIPFLLGRFLFPLILGRDLQDGIWKRSFTIWSDYLYKGIYSKENSDRDNNQGNELSQGTGDHGKKRKEKINVQVL